MITIFLLFAQLFPQPGPRNSSQGPISWITSVTATGTVRNNYPSPVGAKIKWLNAKTAIGIQRLCLTGNSQTHNAYIVDATGTVLVTTSIDMAGCTPGQLVDSLFFSFSMLSNTVYFVGGNEFSGGDTWYSNDALYAFTADATDTSAAYASSDPPVGVWTLDSGKMYSTYSIKYLP